MTSAPDVPRDVPPIASSPRVTLLETEVVTGPGAAAFSAPTILEVGEGAEGTPLIAPEPPPPPATTSPEEAALIGKAVGAYVGFGWGLMAAKHQDKLVMLAETVTQGRPELAGLSAEQKFAMGFVALVGVVEKSATAIALKHNIRIPYQDEGIVAIAIGTATVGIVQEFRPRNDNKTRAARAASSAPPRDVTPPQEPASVHGSERVDLGDSPSARANEPTDAELVL